MDMILLEAFPKMYAIKQKFGEEVLVELMEMFGGNTLQIPSENVLRKVYELYFEQFKKRDLAKKYDIHSVSRPKMSNRMSALLSPREIFLDYLKGVNEKPINLSYAWEESIHQEYSK